MPFVLPPPVESAPPWLGKLLAIDRLNELSDRVRAVSEGRPAVERLLEAMEIGYWVDERDLARIPRSGPLIAVANLPFGMVEGAILAALLPRVRPDVRILTHDPFAVLSRTELGSTDRFLWLRPFRRGAPPANLQPLREAIAWVRTGGMLVVFPAGDVAHLEIGRRRIVDRSWDAAVSRLIRRTGASALPIFFDGANSAPFQMLSLLHPALCTMRLPHEFLNKRGKRILLRIGSPVPWKRLARFKSGPEMRDYLYQRTYLLANRRAGRVPRPVLPALHLGVRRPHPVAAPGDAAAVAAEVSRLPAESRLGELDQLAVFVAPAAAIPNTLREIGRLRELSFRAAGEGTGLSLDLDRFDQDYEHLFLWNQERTEIAGAYRVGRADALLASRGLSGIYTHTLFEFSPEFFAHTGPALELGRSFVRPEYQRDFAPLLLLWKGIGALVMRSPRYAVLFGPVSISNDYQAVSRQFMVRFLKSRCGMPEMAPLARARHPFRLRRPETWDLEVTRGFVDDIDELSELVAEIEADGKGVPILIKQYLKLGGRLLEFNVDARFSGALDGLVVVDLRQTDARILQRYMGRDGARAFRRWHGLEGSGRDAVSSGRGC